MTTTAYMRDHRGSMEKKNGNADGHVKLCMRSSLLMTQKIVVRPKVVINVVAVMRFIIFPLSPCFL